MLRRTIAAFRRAYAPRDRILRSAFPLTLPINNDKD
jgi:hypothetical protein